MSKLIDATKALNANAINEFKANHDDNAIVTMYIDGSEYVFEETLTNMRKFFENEDIEKLITNDCVIYFMYKHTDDIILKIAGIDYTWWIAPYRKKKYGRLKILFNDEINETIKETKQKIIKVDNLHKCMIVKPKDDELQIVATFEGKMKDLLIFVNKQRQLDLLKTFFKSDLLFAFDYQDDITLDKSNFKSYEELVNEGVFVL